MYIRSIRATANPSDDLFQEVERLNPGDQRRLPWPSRYLISSLETWSRGDFFLCCVFQFGKSLRRHGVANLRQLQWADGRSARFRPRWGITFRDYEPGLLHADIKALPRMPARNSGDYLFVAIDRAIRWVFMHIYADKVSKQRGLLNQLERAAPVRSSSCLTAAASSPTTSPAKA